MKKKIFIPIVSVVALIVISLTLSLIVSKRSTNKTTYIGFYDINKEYQKIYKDIIKTDNNGLIEFITLSDKDINSNRLNKKIDVLITYNGCLTQQLKETAITLTDDIKSRYPRTITSSPLFCTKDEMKIFPLSFDLFETSVLTTAVNYYDLPIIETIEDVTNYGLKAMEVYPIPIVISGSDDLTLNCFFTSLVDAFGGENGYYNIAKQMKEDPLLDNFYNYVIKNENGNTITVSSVLDLIKDWENKSILSKTWRTTTFSNTAQLIEDNRVTLALMTLQEHRKVLSDNLNYYETILFPVSKDATTIEHVSVQPSIVCMLLNEKPQSRIITNRLSSSSNQELISLQTQLGPSTLQGTSFDRQADDARFFAASYPSGPVPDLGSLVFTDKAMQKKMADLIRNY